MRVFQQLFLLALGLFLKQSMATQEWCSMSLAMAVPFTEITGQPGTFKTMQKRIVNAFEHFERRLAGSKYYDDFARLMFPSSPNFKMTSSSIRELAQLRTKFDPQYKDILTQIGLYQDGQVIIPRAEQEAAVFLRKLQDQLKKAIQNLKNDYGLQADEILTPTTFIRNPDLNETSSEKSIYHEMFYDPKKQGLFGNSTISIDSMVDTVYWNKFFNLLNVLPISTYSGYTSIFYHDIHHVIAALAHPYEELVVLKKFYKIQEDLFERKPSETPNNQNQTYEKFIRRTMALNLFLVEQGSLPDLDQAHNLLNKIEKSSIFSVPNSVYIVQNGKSIFSYKNALDILKKEWDLSSEEPTPLRNLLAKFAQKIKINETNDQHFFNLFHRFGGDSYDLANLYKNTSIYNPIPLGAHLEILYWQAKRATTLKERETALLAIFASFTNANSLSITFKKIVDDFVESHQSAENRNKNAYVLTDSYLYFNNTFPNWAGWLNVSP